MACLLVSTLGYGIEKVSIARRALVKFFKISVRQKSAFTGAYRDAFDHDGITIKSTMKMEDLVHDLPLAVQFQQREHVRETRSRPIVDFQAHVRDRANDVDF